MLAQVLLMVLHRWRPNEGLSVSLIVYRRILVDRYLSRSSLT